MVQQRDFQILEGRVAQIEMLLGAAPEAEGSQRISIHLRLQELEAAMREIRHSVDQIGPFVEDRLTSCEEGVSDVTEALDVKIGEVMAEITLLKRAVAAGSGEGMAETKLRVPQPKHYEGDRSSKVLENFLWDLEEYFKAAHVADREKVSMAGMYLAGDAKLWWRSRRTEDARQNRAPITSWDVFTTELRLQFLPRNTAWVARDALRNLKHESSIHAYVNEFTSLMLQIKDMSEEDKLFNFLAGLQPWAQTELKRQRVKDLTSALVAAEELVDYRAASGSDKTKSDRAKDKGKASKKKDPSVAPTEGGGQTHAEVPKKKQGCFICNGDHRMRDCPKRAGQGSEKLNAMQAESDEEEVRLNSLVHLSGMQLIDAASDESGVDRGASAVEGNLAGKQPSVGRGEPTYAEALARAKPSKRRELPKEPVRGEQVVAVKDPVRKGFTPETTRTSSSSGGGGLLRG